MTSSLSSLLTLDKLDLVLHAWEAPGADKAIACLVHGLGEHSRRYDHLALFLNEKGCTVLAIDLRGHGASGGSRGDAPSYNHFINDISSFLHLAAERYPDKPLFLYGHSFGGLLVINYVLRRLPTLTGVIATGPLLKTAFVPPAGKIIFARLMKMIWPSLTLAGKLDATAISRDPQVVSAYLNDPLVHNRLSVRMGIDMLDAGPWALDNASKLNLPLLIMHGDSDRLCSLQSSRDFAARAGGLCTLKVWPGLFHEIHNEPEKDEVFAYLIGWIDNQLVESACAIDIGVADPLS